MTEKEAFESSSVKEVTPSEPCLHCDKSDWCYRLGSLSVCKRGAAPAMGWQETTKTDSDGSRYYAPEPKPKAVRPKNYQGFIYHDREDQRLIKVTRVDDGEGKRDFFQSHWNGQRWIKGVPKEFRPRVPIYRYREVVTAIAAGEPIFLVEGEGCADRLYEIGLVATTTLGGSKKYRSYGDYTQDLAEANLILCPDRDQPGLAHMKEVAKDFPNARWLFAPPSDFFWSHLPESGGLDIADWISDGATADDIRAVIQRTFQDVPDSLSAMETPDPISHAHAREKTLQFLTPPAAEEIFTQKAQDALYSETAWISLNNSLYRWTGNHYKLSADPIEKGRIAQWCKSTPVEEASGQWKFAYAKATFVDAIWHWVLLDFAIDPAAVNPPGINCLNGFLEIQWEGPKASWRLLPHDPQRYCTYVSEVEFNPDADPVECERLLACLDPAQQRLFIQTLAASLDLEKIRQYRGREVRALLLKGHGNNGKDSLREAVRLLYGIGLTNATVTDFLAYDQGRKFTLAKLEGARINWSSENSSFSNLDALQSLKAAITGDPLDMERKGVDEHQMMPSCIFLFNINEAPNLKAGLEAIQSRWAVLTFTKTYKIGADPTKGELEADSRFRYDPAFLKALVVPGLLNKMLAALPELAINGLDYKCTEQALEAIQQETNHLWAFAQEVGLAYKLDGRVYINDLWERLKDWYLANGTLTVTYDDRGKEKQEWHDQPRRGDKNVKAANQVHQRFSEIFPKIVRSKDTSRSERTGQAYLVGIGFDKPHVKAVEPDVEAAEPNVEPNVEARSLMERDVEAAEPMGPTLPYALSIISFLSPMERKLLQEEFLSSCNGIGKIGSAASTSTPEGVTDSTTASTSGSAASTSGSAAPISQGSSIKGKHCGDITVGQSIKNFAQPATREFQVGDRVALNNPKAQGYNWNGLICEIKGHTAKVFWVERETIRGGQVVVESLKDLRLL